MSDHLQILLSRSTPKVKHKIFELLHRQSANLTYNTQQDMYHIDMKIVSHSRQILDQIATSLTQTIEEMPGRQHQYSFSRVLDPLEIYDTNIKMNHKVDYEMLGGQFENVIDESFGEIKKMVEGKGREMKENPEVESQGGGKKEKGREKEKERGVGESKGGSRYDSRLEFQRIEEESGEDEQNQSANKKQNDNDNESLLLGLSRIMPKKMSLQTSSSKSMINYFKRIVKGIRDEKE